MCSVDIFITLYINRAQGTPSTIYRRVPSHPFDSLDGALNKCPQQIPSLAMYRRRPSNRVARRYLRRRPVRRTYAGKRRFAKRRLVRRRVTRKSLLNLTSRKKKDQMMQMSASDPNGVLREDFVARSAYVRARNASGPAENGGLFYWNATQRAALTASDGSSRAGPPVLYDEATRTATTCFMRGVSETLHFETTTARPWKWRRICLVTHDTRFGDPILQSLPLGYSGNLLTSDGYTRPWYNMVQITNDGGKKAEIYDLIFDGVTNSDWENIMTAKIDTRRVSVKYDRTRVLFSGNDSGLMRTFKHWHPMNKNLVYDDEQYGGSESSATQSVTSKAGMGNYVILDIFQCQATGTPDDVLKIDSQTCLYWHEK